MDTGDCQPLYHAIRDYYEGMYMKLEQEIPMLLVERQALNEAIVGEKSVMSKSLLCSLSFFGLRNSFNSSLVLCRASITCPRRGVYAFRKSRLSPVYEFRQFYSFSFRSFLKLKWFMKLTSTKFSHLFLLIPSCVTNQILRRPIIGGYQFIGIRTQPQKLKRRCEVTAILVLYGLPR